MAQWLACAERWRGRRSRKGGVERTQSHLRKEVKKKNRVVQSEAWEDEKLDYGERQKVEGCVRCGPAVVLKRRGTRVITASGGRPTCRGGVGGI